MGDGNADPRLIEREALRLPVEGRAQLAQKLLLSLDAVSEEERKDIWLTEASRRARELDRGEVEPLAADKVRRKASLL